MSDPRKEAAERYEYAYYAHPEDICEVIRELLAYTDELEAELDRLRGHEGETCQDCGRRYSHVYRVPDDVWEKITPHPPEGGLLCIDCAAFRASEIGIELYFEGEHGDWYTNKLEAKYTEAWNSAIQAAKHEIVDLSCEIDPPRDYNEKPETGALRQAHDRVALLAKAEGGGDDK